MPRVARGLADGLIYHITNKGNGRQQVFQSESDYRAFVDLMVDASERYPVKVLAWCIMPNHYHLLVSPERAEELSAWMQWFMTSHVRRYHSHYRTSGHVWQGRYKSFIVQEDAHLLTVARYIEANPVRAQIDFIGHGMAVVFAHLPCCWGSRALREKMPVKLPADWTDYVDQPQTESELERLHNSINGKPRMGRRDGKNGLSRPRA